MKKFLISFALVLMPHMLLAAVNGTANISGTATEGETLTASASDPDGTTNSTFTYQWKRAGANISGAT